MKSKDEKDQDNEILEKLVNYNYELKEYLIKVKYKKRVLEEKIINIIQNKGDNFFETKYVIVKLKNKTKVKSTKFLHSEKDLINELINQEKYEFIDFNINNKNIKKIAKDKFIFEKYRMYVINEQSPLVENLKREIIDYLYYNEMINVLSVNIKAIKDDNKKFDKVLADKCSQLLNLCEYQLDIELKEKGGNYEI